MSRLSLVRTKPKSSFPWAWLGLSGVAAYVAYSYFSGTNVVSDEFTTLTRTPQDILDAVAEIDPEHNLDLQPVGGVSWCNKFIALVTAKLGAPVIWGPYGTLINDQITWLSAGNDGWYPGSKADAQAAALAGHLAVATYYNLSGGHGHGALVLPYPGAMQIAQAGAQNFNVGPLEKGFGSIQPVFFLHD